MNFTEHCLGFNCAGESVVAIVSLPDQPSNVGLVIVVGGPQYRVGSHRQFVLLARHVAAAGHAVLRFDYRGMGDTCGAARDFLAVSDDIDASIEALRQAVPSVQRVALWGLCDGASAALLYRHDRPLAPLAGLCLLNPWVRSAQSQATAQVKHYYLQRLKQRAFWLKLFRGQVGLGRLAELGTNLRTMLAGRQTAVRHAKALTYQQRMAKAWQRADCPLLLVLSGNDLTAKEFTETLAVDPAWRDALAYPQLTRLDLPLADHTFSDSAAQTAVERATAQWMNRLAGKREACVEVRAGASSVHHEH